MTDLDTPLNEAERAEFALRTFVQFVVNQAGKFGDEAAAEVLESGLRNPQWVHLEALMNGVRLEAAIGEEIDRLGEFLDFFSYTRIIREYVQFYPPPNDRKQTIVAIVHVLLFARLYARRLRKRMQIAGANEQFAQRNLDQLVTYTVLSVQHLLQQGLHSNWTQFCEQAADFQLVQPAAQLPLNTTFLTVAVAGGIVGVLGFWLLVNKTRSTA